MKLPGQTKKAVQLSRQFGLIQTISDRISSYAFQASKEVKTNTNLSSGKYSVSFAAAELIKAYQDSFSIERILIVGSGEMGRAMARNMKEYFPQCKLYLTNRTQSHAEQLASELLAQNVSFEGFNNHLDCFDVVITTAESDNYLIDLNDLRRNASCLLLDLSVPQVINPNIKTLPQLTHYSVDEISLFHNELIKQRRLEVPKAEQIIEEFIGRLAEWQKTFQHTGLIMSYKEKMVHAFSSVEKGRPEIEKSFSGLIRRIKSDGYRGCTLIQTMNELMAFEK
ncbi:MAG: NAD(P)-binding domain-containing protein [Bacteroidota bacterium]